MAVRHIVDLVDEDRALFRQLIHNIPVMHDLAAHIDGSPEGLQRDLHNVNRPHYAWAKATGVEEKNALLTRGSPGGITIGGGIKSSQSHFSIISTGMFSNREKGR